jgi:hypothetical protein
MGGANLHEEIEEEEEEEQLEEGDVDNSMAFKTKSGKVIKYGSEDDE